MEVVCHVGRSSGLLLLGYHHVGIVSGLPLVYCALPSCFCTGSRLCFLLSPRVSLLNSLIPLSRLNRASTTPPKRHLRSRGTPTTIATHPTSTQHIMSSQILVPWVVPSSSTSRSSCDTTRYVDVTVTPVSNVGGRRLPYRQKATCFGRITDLGPAHTGQPCPCRTRSQSVHRPRMDVL